MFIRTKLFFNLPAFPGSQGAVIVNAQGRILGLHLGYHSPGRNIALDLTRAAADIMSACARRNGGSIPFYL